MHQRRGGGDRIRRRGPRAAAGPVRVDRGRHPHQALPELPVRLVRLETRGAREQRRRQFAVDLRQELRGVPEQRGVRPVPRHVVTPRAFRLFEPAGAPSMLPRST